MCKRKVISSRPVKVGDYDCLLSSVNELPELAVQKTGVETCCREASSTLAISYLLILCLLVTPLFWSQVSPNSQLLDGVLAITIKPVQIRLS
jgi:hypothetical protein